MLALSSFVRSVAIPCAIDGASLSFPPVLSFAASSRDMRSLKMSPSPCVMRAQEWQGARGNQGGISHQHSGDNHSRAAQQHGESLQLLGRGLPASRRARIQTPQAIDEPYDNSRGCAAAVRRRDCSKLSNNHQPPIFRRLWSGAGMAPASRDVYSHARGSWAPQRGVVPRASEKKWLYPLPTFEWCRHPRTIFCTQVQPCAAVAPSEP